MVDFIRQKPSDPAPMTMAQAKEWLMEFLGQIKDGGHWAIPRANSIYRIDHARQVAVRIEGEGDKATEEVLAAIGWTIEEKENGKKNTMES